MAPTARAPVLIITHGPSGTGKTTLAEGLARRLPFEVLSSDRIRKELAQHAPSGGSIYTPAFTRRTYSELIRRAEQALATGRSVILDATFLRRWQRRHALLLARRARGRFFCLDCRADEQVVKPRLEARDRDPNEISDARFPVYLAQRKKAEPLTELDQGDVISIDTSAPLAKCVASARAELNARRILPRRSRSI